MRPWTKGIVVIAKNTSAFQEGNGVNCVLTKTKNTIHADLRLNARCTVLIVGANVTT